MVTCSIALIMLQLVFAMSDMVAGKSRAPVSEDQETVTRALRQTRMLLMKYRQEAKQTRHSKHHSDRGGGNVFETIGKLQAIESLLTALTLAAAPPAAGATGAPPATPSLSTILTWLALLG